MSKLTKVRKPAAAKPAPEPRPEEEFYDRSGYGCREYHYRQVRFKCVDLIESAIKAVDLLGMSDADIADALKVILERYQLRESRAADVY